MITKLILILSHDYDIKKKHKFITLTSLVTKITLQTNTRNWKYDIVCTQDATFLEFLQKLRTFPFQKDNTPAHTTTMKTVNATTCPELPHSHLQSLKKSRTADGIV